MKKTTILITALLPCVMMGEEVIFQLDFNNNNIRPVIAKGGKAIGKAVKLDNAKHFPDGFIGKGFRNDAKENPLEVTYSADRNFSFPQGTISFWCKTPNPATGKNQRMLHIYSPRAGKESAVLIYTFFLSASGEFICRNELSETHENTVVRIPASEVDADKFFKVDVTWNGKLLSVYKNGELQEDTDLPEAYVKEAALPRGWSAFFVLHAFASLNDDPASGMIIDEIKCFDVAMDADAVRSAYEADLKRKEKQQ